MHYKAIRKSIDHYENDKLGNFGPYCHYQLLQNELVIGDFFYKNMVSYFSVDGNQYNIPTPDPIFGKLIYLILTAKTRIPIATIRISPWRESFFNEIGSVLYEEKIYRYKRSFPKIIKSSLLSIKSKVAVDFFIKDDAETLSYHSIYNRYLHDTDDLYRPNSDFSMEINSSSRKMILLYTGLFLIEKFWNYRNYSPGGLKI
jgi:hypothetical protein